MMEYFTSKKSKKGQADKNEKRKSQVQVQSPPSPLISPEDENFLGRIISAEGTPPPLPDRPSWVENPEVGDSKGNQSQMTLHEGAEDVHERKKSSSSERRKKSGSNDRKKSVAKDKGKGKEKDNKRGSVFSFFQKKNKDGLEPEKDVPEDEAEDEIGDISRILDDLNLSASNNRAFSLPTESQKLVKEFTVILKDLINGAPHAYDDLVALLNDSQGTLARSYDHLPPFLKKMITTLPNKLTGTLAPELLAVATEAQANLKGTSAEEVSTSGGLKGVAKGLISTVGLRELVTKPGAVVKLLKAIMNALKLRWPAFMGTNVLLSLALFVLLFVFWYCHKRGRETRLEREGKPVVVDSEGLIVELEDDPMLTAGPTQTTRVAHERGSGIEDGVAGPSTRRREEDRSGSSGSGRRRSGDEKRTRHRRDKHDDRDRRDKHDDRDRERERRR